MDFLYMKNVHCCIDQFSDPAVWNQADIFPATISIWSKLKNIFIFSLHLIWFSDSKRNNLIEIFCVFCRGLRNKTEIYLQKPKTSSYILIRQIVCNLFSFFLICCAQSNSDDILMSSTKKWRNCNTRNDLIFSEWISYTLIYNLI